MSASRSGSFIPPLYIFLDYVIHNRPQEAIYTCSHNGWANEKIFILWLRYFISHAKSAVETSVLLVLVNHNSHANLDASEFAEENHITMLRFPPYSSHSSSPLVADFFPA